MRLLLDEMISPLVAAVLRSRGVDAIAVQEHASLRGTQDLPLLIAARGERRVIVTNNIRDFRMLQAASGLDGAGHYGVILVPSNAMCSRAAAGRMVAALLEVAETYSGADALRNQELWL